MPQLLLLKMLRNNGYFRKGQKVWAVMTTGDQSYIVMGKYKGHGRWVQGWVHFYDKGDAKHLGFVEVSEEFKILLLSKIKKDCSYHYQDLIEP